MIALIINLLILCLILGLILYIFSHTPILAPFAWLANIICVAIVVIFLIHVLMGFGGASLDWPAYRGR